MKFCSKIYSWLTAPFFLNFIFMGWNFAFLALSFFGIMPWLGPVLIESAFQGTLPLDFLLSLFLVILVPVVCTAIGLLKLASSPRGLMKLFYGIEAPLFILFLCRIFLVREMTFALVFLLATIISSIFIFFYNMFIAKDDTSEPEKKWKQHTAFALQNIMLISAVYIGTLVSFYAVPTGWVIAEAFFKLYWVEALIDIFSHPSELLTTSLWVVLGLFLFATSSALFVGLPPFFALTHGKTWYRNFKKFNATQGRAAYINTGIVIALWIAIFTLSTMQPQSRAAHLLNSAPKTTEDIEAATKDIELIKEALVNQYLNRYRYLSPINDSNTVSYLYRKVIGVPDSVASTLQDAHNFLISPLLYDGDRYDAETASMAYAYIFDTPIQTGEQKAILSAMQATYDRDGIEAGLLNVNEQKVLLTKQEITVADHGEYAEIELFETYENQTFEQQEIFYYFSLPQDATVTGLWLGESSDKSKADKYSVAPRGAAQQVYKDEVQRRIDPALLEQVGPQQYRLKVFPIPRRTTKDSLRDSEQAESSEQGGMHLWLTYKTLRYPNGFPLPKLLQKRNIFWSEDSDRRLAGKTISEDTWLPDYADSKSKGVIKEHAVSLKEGYQVHVRPKTASTESLKNVAVVIDTSYSMRDKIDFAVEQAIDGFKKTDKDIYVVSTLKSESRQLNNAQSESLTCFGHLSLKTLINEFNRIRDNKKYDAVFFLTDAGSYELSSDEQTVTDIAEPVWLVHLDGAPEAYSDQVLDMIHRTNGGAIVNWHRKLSSSDYLLRASKKKFENISQSDYYEWEVQKASSQQDDAGLSPVAAHMVIASSTANKGNAHLDALHQLAKEHHIVSPYSSMIVLVNDRQREALAQASTSSDRFDREVETGTEVLTSPSNLLNVSAVPEPHEWLLIFIGVLLLAFLWYKERSRVES